MEDLNKTQIVLLCLLVSFVTSIGTGIISASLLQEAPQTVTQTINRVVERTVETIVPQPSGGAPTREVTVVVKEEDLIIDAINKNHNSIVRIVDARETGLSEVQTLGIVTKRDGTILADKRYILSSRNYKAVFSDGQSHSLEILGRSDVSNAVFFKVSDVDATQTFSAITLGNSDVLQLGQTVIALGGKQKEAVAIGRIISTDQAPSGPAATSTRTISVVETDTPLRDTVAGSALLNLNGDMIGFENFEPNLKIESGYAAINVAKREHPEFFDSSTN